MLRVSKEAVLNPNEFDLEKRSRRQLRRHLRKAQNAKVTLAEADTCPPWREMRKLADDWTRHRQAKRGFSMGRFDEKYLSAQRIVLARHNGKLVGFVSFHDSWKDRALDLLCHSTEAPAGTTYAMIYEAISIAKREGCQRMSLAAVPGLADQEWIPRSPEPRGTTPDDTDRKSAVTAPVQPTNTPPLVNAAVTAPEGRYAC